MAKMTKAQARKRLDEAHSKIMKVWTTQIDLVGPQYQKDMAQMNSIIYKWRRKLGLK